MLNLETIKNNCSKLFDDQQDHWQWTAIGLCIIGAIIGAIILRKTFLCKDSACNRFLTRFFAPGKSINNTAVLTSIFLWSTWSIRNTWYSERVAGAINLWSIISAIAAMFLLIWLAGLTTRFIDTVVKPRRDIPPSIKVLIGKAVRIVLYLGAIIWALKIGGVPLGGLAVFSGALGLGLGFGLQKVISNLVSGVIILLDKSIKPGDVIEIDGTFGWINSIRTRFISVITRDRKEILIPNEDFVTNKVINWSFTDRIVRIKADVGVSYSTDVPKAIEVCKGALESIPRVLKNPEPGCLLMGFGDSSIDLQVRFWIDDAPQGVSNIRSEVLIAVWKAFKEHNIEIPFPQRDLHIKSSEVPLSNNH